jgi:ABC-type sugar transport system, ATPase component
MELVRCDDLTLVINGTKILDSINFSISKNEFQLLLGNNASGKSTLIKMLSGIFPSGSYSGRIIFEGKEVFLRTPKDALQAGIVTLYQDPCLYPNLSVAENLFGPSGGTVLRKGCSPVKLISAANTFLKSHGLEIDSSKLMQECSSAEQRMIELIRLYLFEPKLLILDEPLALLNDTFCDAFISLIQHFKSIGTTILCISHNYKMFIDLVDRVAVINGPQNLVYLNKNEILEQLSSEDLQLNELLKNRYPKIKVSIGKEIFCAEHIGGQNSIHNISFSLHQGEILGIFCYHNNEKNDLEKLLFGIEPLQQGQLYFDRLPAEIKSPKQAIDLGIALVSNQHMDSGLYHNLSILDNVFSVKGNFDESLFSRTKYQRKKLAQFTESLNIRQTPGSLIKTLSSGEQQKLLIMKWVITRAKVYIIDDPTQSIDIPSKIDIYNMFNNLVIRGSAIIVFSSNMEELLGICDKVLFVDKGSIVSGASNELL